MHYLYFCYEQISEIIPPYLRSVNTIKSCNSIKVILQLAAVAEGENHFPFFASFVIYIYLLILKASETYWVICSITTNSWELVKNADSQA